MSRILSSPRTGLAGASQPTRALALALALGVLSACSSGTGPDGAAGRLVAAGASTTWVYQYDDLRTEPLLSAGPIVADTLRLAADFKGRWSIIYLDVLDGTTRRRNEVDIFWSAFAEGDSLRIVPTCGPPTELCDPLPPWVGAVTRTGSLLLASTLPSAGSRIRRYAKVNR